MTQEKAMKFDDGKLPIDLIDQEIIIELAKVLGYGAKKYKAHNWKNGLPISRYYSALQRHILAFNNGETVDPESGLNHLGHAACNLMFMIYMMKNKPHLDDRFTSKIDKAFLLKVLQDEYEKDGIDFKFSLEFEPASTPLDFDGTRPPVKLPHSVTGEDV